ncbi:otoancorin-like [Daktulosphaira vitifoliae]|uniref:otoancorin-like n=1 Tax=Daktulosphaira vitifoliae TaxID=58002 RepID=UPI0021A980E6|nr:otoancorin-like [Daktulosphaira vitifoliae]
MTRTNIYNNDKQKERSSDIFIFYTVYVLRTNVLADFYVIATVVKNICRSFKIRSTDTELKSCDESLLKRKGKFSKTDINGLITQENKEQLKTCLTIMGKNRLEKHIATALWKDLVKVHKTVDNVPEEDLQLLGWIASGIPALDFLNISLTDIETIAAFGKYRNFSEEQLIFLKQAIEYQWSYKNPSDFSGYDLAALGQILCVFNNTQIAEIKPLAFKAAAADISNLLYCPEDVMKELANLAKTKDAFGDPSEWTAIQIALIGCVIAGLDSVRNIHPEAFEGLAASSMQCLPSTTLQSMTIEQLSHLSLSSVHALSYDQRSSLSADQLDAIQRTTNLFGSVLKSSYSKNSTTWWCFFIIIIHILLYT